MGRDIEDELKICVSASQIIATGANRLLSFGKVAMVTSIIQGSMTTTEDSLNKFAKTFRKWYAMDSNAIYDFANEDGNQASQISEDKLNTCRNPFHY